MQNNNNIQHSAEGSHWTKKNHKYIRKEGNRYIYPSDLKKISQQHANRQNAKNGKLINPTATYRDENGNVALRLHTKGAYSTPNQADYKQYSKEMANEKKRKAAAGSPNEYVRNQEHAKKMTNIMNSPAIHPKYKDGIGPSPMSKQRGKLALRKQGSNSNYKELSQQHAQEQNRKNAANGGPTKHTVLYYDHKSGAFNEDNYTSDQEWAKNRTAKGSARSSWTKDQLNQKKRSKALNSQGSVNRQQEAKDFKEYQDWEKSDQKKRDTSAKRQKALNNQGKVDRQNQTKHTEYEKKIVERKIPETKEYEKIEVEKTDKSPANSKSRTSKLKDRVSKAISNLKNKKTKKNSNQLMSSRNYPGVVPMTYDEKGNAHGVQTLVSDRRTDIYRDTKKGKKQLEKDKQAAKDRKDYDAYTRERTIKNKKYDAYVKRPSYVKDYEVDTTDPAYYRMQYGNEGKKKRKWTAK